jgi:hypothetical protein
VLGGTLSTVRLLLFQWDWSEFWQLGGGGLVCVFFPFDALMCGAYKLDTVLHSARSIRCGAMGALALFGHNGRTESADRGSGSSASEMRAPGGF